MTAALLLLSSLLQIAVAIIAIRAPRSARSRSAWWMFAAAMSLMAVRRLVGLSGILHSGSDSPARPMEEAVAVAISSLLLVGMLQMRRLWRDADRELEDLSSREAARREGENLWQRVFEYAPDGYILLQLDGRLDRMNLAAAEISGIPREEAEGRNILELGLLDEDGMAQAARNLGILRDGRDPGAAEYTFHRSDGTTRQVEIIGYLIEVRGEPLMLTIVHDVTRRRAAEEELRRNRLRLEEAQRVAGIVSFDIDLRSGRVWLSGDLDIGTKTPDGRTEISFEQGLEFIHPDDREHVLRHLVAASAGGDPGEIVVEYRQTDSTTGEEMLVRTTSRVEKDEDGNIVGMIGATLDITEIRRAEQEIRSLNTELEERVRERTADLQRAVDELGAFSYSVSHDLRSPLRAMAGYSEVVLEEDGDRLSRASRDHLERIRASSVRMGRLIDGLLSLSRLTRATRNDAVVDLSDMARSILAELRSADPGRDVEIAVEEGLEVTADAGMMALVLQNLLSNAWKFTRQSPNARITFGRDSRGGYVVRDNGVGFDASQAAKLFRPFERLHRTDEFEGTGIGLATVERIVRHHGGVVEADGAIGKGATFRFTLGPAPD